MRAPLGLTLANLGNTNTGRPLPFIIKLFMLESVRLKLLKICDAIRIGVQRC
jgi:hypothetical protein